MFKTLSTFRGRMKREKIIRQDIGFLKPGIKVSSGLYAM